MHKKQQQLEATFIAPCLLLGRR